MDDMLSQISNILENPDALDKIKSIAAELGGVGGVSGGGGASSPAPSEGGGPSASSFSEAAGLLSGLNINFDGSRAIALLEAIRPFMRESRVPKVNTAIKAVQMMGVLSKLK